MGKIKISEERQEMLDSFRKKIESLRSLYLLEEAGDLVYVLHEKSQKESVSMTFLGLTHGNEISGFFILMEFCDYLLRVKPKLPFSIGLAFGNLKGFKEDKRFVESDMNRSFASSVKENWEQERALALEGLLSRTDFLLDFHQTQRPSLRPFFIFPYTKKSLHFAARLNPKIPIVTHWGKGFSKDGMCTDEFVNSKGGVGITLETGYCGADPLQIALAFSLILKAVFYEPELYLGKNISSQKGLNLEDLEIYTWSLVYPYPEKNLVTWDEDLPNFSYVEKGKNLARDGENSIESSSEGFLLFPKYVKKGEIPPKELFRLIKKVSLKDLPSD